MKLFDKDGQGAREIVRAVGLIGNDISFDKWEALLPFGIRDVTAIIGTEPVEKIASKYAAAADEPDTCALPPNLRPSDIQPGEPPSFDAADYEPLIAMLQKAVAFFTWLKMIPTLDAQHDASGRGRRLGENEKGLTALEQFKDEENIRSLAYEAVDALVDELDRQHPFWWVLSAKYKQREGLMLPSRTMFDEYYLIGSSRLYLTLLPIIREVQLSEIRPLLGAGIYEEVLDCSHPELLDMCRRALALLTMKKAVERLPVEVIPEGVVQVQQSQPVRQRLRAEKEARQSVAASLEADARRYLTLIQDAVAALKNADTPAVTYVPRPINHSTGFTF